MCVCKLNPTWHLLAVAPSIIPFSFGSSIFGGQAIQITCLVRMSGPPLDLTWSYNGLRDVDVSLLGISTTERRKANMLLIDLSLIHI